MTNLLFMILFLRKRRNSEEMRDRVSQALYESLCSATKVYAQPYLTIFIGSLWSIDGSFLSTSSFLNAFAI